MSLLSNPVSSVWRKTRQRSLFPYQWRFSFLELDLLPSSSTFHAPSGSPTSKTGVLVMYIALGGVRRSDQDSPEKLEFCRRPRDGCSDASSPELDSGDSLASSSIGRNSDASGSLSNYEEGGENEAQSKSSSEEPLDMMESLEEALPLRRGISKFYEGKSKSFTVLAEASSASSMKDIGKSENAYTRKRRNLLAFSHVWDKNRTISRRSGSFGITKRGINSNRSTLALAIAMSSSGESINCEDWNSRSAPLGPGLNHLRRASGKNAATLLPPPCNFSTWRSYSVADMQKCAPAATLTK